MPRKKSVSEKPKRRVALKPKRPGGYEKLRERLPHYYICSVCAAEKGGVWPEGHCATVLIGQCPYCHTDNVTIIPYVDFNWPEWKPVDGIDRD